jgi:hypothetical protein
LNNFTIAKSAIMKHLQLPINIFKAFLIVAGLVISGGLYAGGISGGGPIDGDKQDFPRSGIMQNGMRGPTPEAMKLDDNLEMVIPGNWNNSTGVDIYQLTEGRGYVFGTNIHNDRAKGQKFWLEEEIVLEGAIFWFPLVEYGGGTLTFKVWDMTSSSVGQVIASKTVSIGDISPAEDFSEAFHLSFDEPVTLSGDFMIGFVMDNVMGSEIAMVGSLSGEGGNLGMVYEQWENLSWWRVIQTWGLDVDLAIFPLKYTGDVPTSAPVPPVTEILNLYPNPARGMLNIESSREMQEIRILDMLGKVVLSLQPNDRRVQVDTSGFWPGIYFVQVFAGQEVTTKRVQVSR